VTALKSGAGTRGSVVGSLGAGWVDTVVSGRLVVFVTSVDSVVAPRPEEQPTAETRVSRTTAATTTIGRRSLGLR